MTDRQWTASGSALFAVILVAACIGSTARGETEKVDFGRQVRPLLADRCFRCHGPDEAKVEAGVRLDIAQRATSPVDSGAIPIVPGDPDSSELIARITHEDEAMRMPPTDAGPPLSADEVALLRRWIEQGARYEDHWAFVPPQRPALPEVRQAAWARNPIDRFVLARLEKAGGEPAPEADRHTLIRRVSLALTGLPPAWSDVERFVHDGRPDAYERMVERYLADPAYGERWARVWLDLARYADSAGYAQDPVRTIWRYRDWVIQAINRNLPFDQFTVEQLAGDLLGSPTQEQLIATAFHRNTMTNSEGGTDDEEFRVAAVVDRINTTWQVWMGLTLECAQCHNHKYDPITQEEYYKVFAIFNNTADADRGDESPNLEEYSPKQQEARQQLQQAIARLEALPEDSADRKPLEDLKKQLASIQPIRTPIMQELRGDQRRTTYIHVRGNFRVKGAEVTEGVPERFAPPSAQIGDRLEFAKWLVSRDNPLTARVTVNRYWEQLFGVGLVETSEDFGTQGALPSHPELLDWLACQLIDSGWDIKSLLRLIVTSSTFRQSARTEPWHLEHDPQNRLLSRGPRFRLSAEMIRDQALSAAGLLSRRLYGPSVRPLQPKLGINAAFGGSVDWDPSPGEDRYRRGLYTTWRRTSPYPSMITFDAPSREFCTVRRVRTNTPLQALVTLNDPVFVEAAQGLARRMMAAGAGNAGAAVEFGVRQVLARPASADEREALLNLLHDARRQLADDPSRAVALATDPLGPLPDSVDPIDAASWTVVANILLNLDETLNRP